MGLDMYLNARRYVSTWSERDKDLRAELDNLAELTGLPIQEVKCDAMYWRKANAIHDWFVKNVQKGVDDCGSYFVSKEKLKELLALCKEVLENKNKASELLPTANGFFFGTTEYDEWYFEYVQNTVDGLEKLLSNERIMNDFDFEYQSSW